MIRVNKNYGQIAIIIVFLVVAIWTGRSLFQIITTSAPDFSVLWLAARDLASHKNPYLNSEIFTAVNYPPTTLILYVPLTLVSYKTAQAVFVLLAFICVIGLVVGSLRLNQGAFSWQNLALATSLVLLSFPTKFTLGMGQSNSIAFLLLLLAYWFYKRKRTSLGGIVLGLAISLKPILASLLLFFLIKKAWPLILYALLTAGLLTIFALLVSNFNLYTYYFTQVIPPLFNLLDREIYYNQGIMGFISRITSSLFLRQYLSLVVSLVLLVATSWLTLKRRATDLGFSLFIITLLLVDTLSWQHHFVWLIFPFILLTNEAFKKRSFPLLGLIGISYLLVSWNFKNPVIFSQFPMSFLLSNTFYGGLILFAINVHFLVKSKKA